MSPCRHIIPLDVFIIKSGDDELREKGTKEKRTLKIHKVVSSKQKKTTCKKERSRKPVLAFWRF